MLRKKIGNAVLVLLALGFCGCRSDRYYQDRAAQRAREYLLDEAPELNAEQRWFVRFRDPVLLYGEGFQASGPTGKLQQICVAWQIPGQDKLYLVYGMSSERMDFWRPRRLIRKNYVRTSLPVDEAIRNCRKYAENNLVEQLSRQEYNTVRFLPPDVLLTSFELNFNPSGTLSDADAAKLREEASRKLQISLTWPCADGKKSLVFAGVAASEVLTGWNLNFGGLLETEDIKKHTVRVLQRSGDVEKAAAKQLQKAVQAVQKEK